MVLGVRGLAQDLDVIALLVVAILQKLIAQLVIIGSILDICWKLEDQRSLFTAPNLRLRDLLSPEPGILHVRDVLRVIPLALQGPLCQGRVEATQGRRLIRRRLDSGHSVSAKGWGHVHFRIRLLAVSILAFRRWEPVLLPKVGLHHLLIVIRRTSEKGVAVGEKVLRIYHIFSQVCSPGKLLGPVLSRWLLV